MFDSSPWLSYQPKQWQTSCVRYFIPSHCCWIGLTDLSKVCLGRRGFVDGLPSVPSSYSPDMYDRRRESAFLPAYLHSAQFLWKESLMKVIFEAFFVIFEKVCLPPGPVSWPSHQTLSPGPHSRPSFQAYIPGPHSKPSFQALISGSHYRPSFQALLTDTPSSPVLQALLLGTPSSSEFMEKHFKLHN